MRQFVLALLASTMIAGGAIAAAPAELLQPVATGSAPAVAGKPTYGSFGFDTAGMDKSIVPGNDFYDYANGNWMKTTQIPADRAGYGMFQKLQDLSLTRTRGILDQAEKRPNSKIGMFYASFMDEAAVDKAGIAPIKPWLAQIAAIGSKEAFVTEMATLQRMGVGGLFDLGVSQDDKDPSAYIVHVDQSGLGLPDRDYYLKDDPKLAKVRTAYVAFLAQMLTMAGMPDAQPRAQAVYDFEHKLAVAHWTRVESRDADKTYNKWARADFEARAPGFPWKPYLTALGVDGQPSFLVAQPSAFADEAKVYAETPLPVLKDYLTLRTLSDTARFLSKPFVDANFAFKGTVLSGVPQNQPRWKRGVSLVSGEMGEAIGQVYVQQYFPPAAKAAADALVHNLIVAYQQRIRDVTWLSPATKQKALAKIAALSPHIGYPDRWRDYSALVIKPGDLLGNVARAEAFEYQRNLNKLGKPVDRGEWQMTPMEINAYADFQMNEIVFPAAILQPPFFDPKADPAVNYGGIGAVIGHEMSHHFDDQGRKYDRTGKLTDWWTPHDIASFTAFTDRLVKQYDAYEPIPGQHIQGALTLGENMADLNGLNVAHTAYLLSLGGKPAPVVDGFTGEQRFYLGWAQVWRTKDREAALRQQLLTDPHSPGEQRVDEVRNMDAWYKAFDVKPADKLYLAPADRITVW